MSSNKPSFHSFYRSENCYRISTNDSSSLTRKCPLQLKGQYHEVRPSFITDNVYIYIYIKLGRKLVNLGVLMNIPSQSGLKVHSCQQPCMKLTELRYTCFEKKLGLFLQTSRKYTAYFFCSLTRCPVVS